MISSNIFFFKGRVALYAILKAIGIKEGDEIILPAFTCVVVPGVIIYLGAKPVYVDIDPTTYNIDPGKIETEILKRGKKVKAILAQNTFGLSADLDPIIEIAKKYELKVIEDCAHGYGGSYKGKPNGTVADVAFFSSQWSKPFSTGLGGIAVTQNHEIAERIKREYDLYPFPSWKERWMLRGLLQSYNLLMTPAIYWSAIKIYRFLSRVGLVTGSSTNEELFAPIKPSNFEKKMAPFQQKKAIVEMEQFDRNLKHRLRVVEKYDRIFERLEIDKPARPGYAVHTFLRYSFLVNDKKEFMRMAEENKIEVGDWFVSPLHPIEGDLSPWGYEKGLCPIAESVCKKIVNLPTHSKIHDVYINRVGLFLEQMKAQGIL